MSRLHSLSHLLKFSITILMSVTSLSAISQSYRVELSGNLTQADSEDYGKAKGGLLSGSYYFKPVEIKNHPLAEAAFLEKSSNIKWSYGYEKQEWNFMSGSFVAPENGGQAIPYMFNTNAENEISHIKPGFEWYIQNTVFYLAGNIQKIDLKYIARRTNTGWSSPYNEDKTMWSASVGLTPLDGLLLWSEFYEDQGDEWNVNAKYVKELGPNAINIEAGYISTDYDRNIVNVAVDYYLNSSLSVGALFFNNENGYYGISELKYANDHLKDYLFLSSDEIFGVRARKFFSDNLAIEASYTWAEDANKYNLGLTWRL